MQEEVEALNQLNTILGWLLGLQERNPDALSFGIIHVCFHDKATLGAAYGAQDASKMLNELARKLRISFRKTDLIARDGGDFWLLVPYTSPDTVTEKVAMLIKIASEDGLDIVDRDVAVFSMPDPAIVNDFEFKSVAEFLALLKKNRHITLRWKQATPAT